MTTLPQTISARPRPAQSVGPLPAVASPALPSAPYTPPAQGGLSGADVWRVVRQNLWLFILAGLLSAAAGYGVNRYLQAHYQRFTADGLVKVQLPRALDPNGNIVSEVGGTDADLATLMRDEATRMQSDELLTGLLTRTDSVTRQSQWLKNKATANGTFSLGKALDVLRGSFNAVPAAGSSYISVAMTAGDPQDAKAILMEIVNTHIETLNQAKQQQRGFETRRLGDYSDERERGITELRDKIKRLGESLGGSDDQNNVVVAQTLNNVLTDMARANTELAEAKQAADAAKDALARGVDPAGVQATVDADPTVRDYRNTVTSLQTNLELLSRTRGVNDQMVKDSETRLELWRDNLREKENGIRVQARGDIATFREAAVTAAQKRVDELQAKQKKLGDDLNEMNSIRAEFDAANRLLEAKQAAFENLEVRLETKKFDATSRSQEQVSWAAQPITPPNPSFPDLKLTMGVCILLGLGLAVGLAFLREILDTSVRSPRDIGRVGQINVLGMIPDAASDPESGDPLELTIANAPHSMSAEQYRLVRSRLGHVTPLETTRTILVTSPQPGDGKTTVACNLAAGMALNGRKILLVDANFRRPALHGVFDLANDSGLSDVLADVGRFDELVRETAVPNLYLLTSGPKPANPTELIEGTPFTDFVDAALDEYDHVVFDSGPILFVSETGALAPQCDGVVSVVRARKSSRGLLGRMRDSLRSLNVEHLGVVLNAVRHQAGGYYSRNIKTFYAYQRDGR